jgi:pSer/pThr/pTyr-binding forkhead associated (FHA) protein
LPDTGVSRRHAELHLQDGTVTLVDLSSTNGTTINGRRVDRARLTDGDRIGVGATVLVYRQDG